MEKNIKIVAYVCSFIIAVAILVAGFANRYQIAPMQLPAYKTENISILVRLDKLTGDTCLVIGDDGHTYFSTMWTVKINEISEKKRLFTNMIPYPCD